MVMRNVGQFWRKLTSYPHAKHLFQVARRGPGLLWAQCCASWVFCSGPLSSYDIGAGPRGVSVHAVGRKEGPVSASEGASSTSTIAEMKEVRLLPDCDGSFAGFSLPVPQAPGILATRHRGGGEKSSWVCGIPRHLVDSVVTTFGFFCWTGLRGGLCCLHTQRAFFCFQLQFHLK